MAWNGGVSLAIWMGGVAVELDAARRIGSGSEQPDEPARDVESLYAAICHSFRRTLVVDILSGASAGGLNGALIAAAIQWDRPLKAEFLRRKWLEIADFGSLLRPLSEEKPTSLMQGEQFRTLLTEAFRDLLHGEEPDDLSPAKVLLDVEATDVVGEERSFYDAWHQPFYAREYRSPLKFRIGGDYKVNTLATAARASASFPAAFESQQLFGDAARLAGFPGQTRWAIDGGMLENAPIRAAIELIPTRPAKGPVKRFLCYVNAAPATHQEADENPDQPPLGKVLEYVVSLPRQGRTIDQLYAMEDATRRGGLTEGSGVSLLKVPRPSLRAAAEALLPGYQQRRALLSLEDLFAGVAQWRIPDSSPANGGNPAAEGVSSSRSAADCFEPNPEEMPAGPGLAGHIMRSLEHVTDLPWIPTSLEAPRRPKDWHWGIRAAERILQLELDVLRMAVNQTADAPAAKAIFSARERIYDGVQALERMHQHFMDPEGEVGEAARGLRNDSAEDRLEALSRLRCLNVGRSVSIWCFLKPAVQAFFDVMQTLPDDAKAGLPSPAHLFGEGPSKRPFSQAASRRFVELSLAVEVIRRTFADDLDIESSQQLHVAQLTPMAPVPLFARKPESDAGPCSPEHKLTGSRLGHFAAFYRSSWRANDFMWGRMDGAAQIARLLVDTERAQKVALFDRTPSQELAGALVPLESRPSEQSRDHDRRRLVWEALHPDETTFDDNDPAALRDELRERLHEDLTNGKGNLTRIVCTRALQYEILREEEPHLFAQVDEDKAQGAYCTAPGWERSTESSWPAVESLRDTRQDSLPERLGRDDPDEYTSTLAVRRIAHSGLVALSALATVLPIGRYLQPVRLPLFAAAGMAARWTIDRIAVVAAFAGAAWYGAARWLTIPKDPADVPVHGLWSVQVLALWVSLLFVLGVILVPAVRAIRTKRWTRHATEGLLAAGLAAAGGGVALVWIWATKNPAEALTAYHATYRPPSQLLLAVTAAGGAQALAQIPYVSRVGSKVLKPIFLRVSVATVLGIGLGGTLAVLCMWNVLAPSFDNWGWKTAIVVLAIAGPIVVALVLRVVAVTWRRIDQQLKRWRRDPHFVEPVVPAPGPGSPPDA